MKSFVLESFTTNELKEVVEFINKYPDTEHIHFFLDSDWGETPVKDALVTLINSYPTKFSISVMKAISNWFMLLREANCSINILKTWYAMHHKWAWSTMIRDWNEIHWEFSKFQVDQLQNTVEDSTFMTGKELKEFNNGKDVYFNKDRLTQILKDHDKIYDANLDIFNPNKPCLK